MKIISYIQDAYEILDKSVVALGNFDGVHKGHQEIIKTAKNLALQNNLNCVVFTFQNHPANFIAGKNVIKNIESFEDKAREIENLGADYLVALPFDKSIQKMKPERFVRHVLVGALKCKIAVCGFNYSFGENGIGSADDLEQLGNKFGFDTYIVPKYEIDGVLVSSTKIREFIAKGKMQDFERFTGRKYSINGSVIEGNHLGTRIGYPTANLNLDSDMTAPLNGVYITNIYVNNLRYNGLTNVGNKPTAGIFDKNAETFIFDFDGDLYGSLLRIEFVNMIREERKFESLDDLSRQIAKDCEFAKKSL